MRTNNNRRARKWLFAAVDRKRETLLDPGLDDVHETRVLQVRTRFIVGKLAALLGSGLMNCTALAHTVIGKQDTGAVLPGFEGVFIFQEPFSDLAVTDLKVPGYPVDIFIPDEQGCSWKPVAAVSRTVIAVRFISGQGIVGRCIEHQRKLLDSRWQRRKR